MSCIDTCDVRSKGTLPLRSHQHELYMCWAAIQSMCIWLVHQNMQPQFVYTCPFCEVEGVGRRGGEFLISSWIECTSQILWFSLFLQPFTVPFFNKKHSISSIWFARGWFFSPVKIFQNTPNFANWVHCICNGTHPSMYQNWRKGGRKGTPNTPKMRQIPVYHHSVRNYPRQLL